VRLAGLALAICGGALIFFVLRSTAAASPKVLSPSSPSGASGGSASSGSGSGTTGGSSSDIGTHAAIDSSGKAYTVNSTYANMTDQQKGDANRFAHANPNGTAA
jgi:hypothetical protein